jgi:tRNA threonylcarbamoyladenosine biosynthesis protein TsaB
MRAPPARRVLAVDASGADFSVALLVDGEEPRLATRPGERAGAGLHVAMEAILAGARLRPRDLDLLVAVRGPGSFTGVRVALAAIQALSRATDVAAVGVDTTAAVARASGRTGLVVVAVDSGQGRVGLAVHRVEGGCVQVVEGPLDASVEEAVALHSRIRGHALRRGVTGPALLAAGFAQCDGPLAEAAAWVGRAGGVVPLEALYLREPAVTPKATAPVVRGDT